jgi:hypothetical protein
MSERTFSTKAGVVFPAVTAVFIILDRRSTRLYLKNHTINYHNEYQCFGSGMFIPDPNFSIPDPGLKKIPNPASGFALKNLSIFNLKNCF